MHLGKASQLLFSLFFRLSRHFRPFYLLLILIYLNRPFISFAKLSVNSSYLFPQKMVPLRL